MLSIPLNLDCIKMITKCIAGVGVTKIVHDIVELNTVINTRSDSIKVWVGTAVISAMIVEQGSDHIDARFDKIVDTFNEVKKEVNKEAAPK